MNQPLLNTAQRQALQTFVQKNPQFSGATGSMEGAALAQCGTDRVMLAGGQISSYITPDAIVPFEAVYRRLPIDGIFTADPSNPCQFEMGSVDVPENMGLVLLDWNFNIYRPSGSAAGDFVLLESNRLSTQVGWTIKSNAQTQGNFHYELNPSPPAGGTPGYNYPPNPGFIPGTTGPVHSSDDQFTQARYAEQQAASGGLNIMPQRHHRQGLMQVPAPWVLHSSASVAVGCHVFRGIQIPIAFFEAELFGFLMPDNDLLAIQKALAPCLMKPGGV